MTRYAIVDLSNLFSRARHVVQGDAFTKAGMALHITFQSLRKLHRDHKVQHMVFAVDRGSWRYDVYPLYKARRIASRQAQKPADLEEAEVFREVLKNLVEYLSEKTRCTVLVQDGMEADDLVARWTQLHPGDEHVIVSCDSDFVQLLSDTVSIYDGINERLISTAGVRNHRGEMLPFQIDSGSGKVKVAQHAKPDPDFKPEAEWWRKALFVKLIRGDSGDGIFSAYPGITFKGSSKRTGIEQAWSDRGERGFHWNNFFQSEWDKATGRDDTGAPIFSRVKVVDEFQINESLIDLTRQPEPVKATLDTAIAEAITKQPVGNVGFAFIKFCAAHDLPSLSADAADHARYLNAPYPLDQL